MQDVVSWTDINMWLIDVKTRELVRFMDIRKVAGEYAILSHTWEDDELTFSDGQNLASKSASQSIAHRKKGYIKVDFTCRQAETEGLRYAWVDTCCINQDSSAELSEAINSMFRWYQNARTCYVYLSDTTDKVMRTPQFWDVSRRQPARVEAEADFVRCRWFTRGWTLQELLAPLSVEFFAKDWTWIGSKRDLDHVLRDITGIRMNIITNPDEMWSCSISERMSWAADRLTTREEDSAYCLLGIFNVNIPLLYGEGPRAFVRLQEEILRTSLDHSLLCWRMSHPAHRNELLAPDVSCFKGVAHLNSTADVYEYDGHQLMSKGLSITLPTRPCGDSKVEIYAALNCSTTTGTEAGYAVLLLRRISREYHGNRNLRTPMTYEIVREVEEIIQPQSLWQRSNLKWRAGVSVEHIVVVPHRVSTTIYFNYPEDRLDITEAYPEYCFIPRSAEFHFIPGRKSPNSDTQQIDSRVELYDKVSGESQYLWIKTSRAFSKRNGRNLLVSVGDTSTPPASMSPMAIWPLKNEATMFYVRSWRRKDIPPGVYVIRIWNTSKDVSGYLDLPKLFKSELGEPTASLLARWNRPGTANDEPIDTDTESISSLGSTLESD